MGSIKPSTPPIFRPKAGPYISARTAGLDDLNLGGKSTPIAGGKYRRPRLFQRRWKPSAAQAPRSQCQRQQQLQTTTNRAQKTLDSQDNNRTRFERKMLPSKRWNAAGIETQRSRKRDRQTERQRDSGGDVGGGEQEERICKNMLMSPLMDNTHTQKKNTAA